MGFFKDVMNNYAQNKIRTPKLIRILKIFNLIIIEHKRGWMVKKKRNSWQSITHKQVSPNYIKNLIKIKQIWGKLNHE
jgi:hypothetical protein